MRQKSGPPEEISERVVKNIRRATRKRYSAEEKIRIVLDGLRGEDKRGRARRCRIIVNGSKEVFTARTRRIRETFDTGEGAVTAMIGDRRSPLGLWSSRCSDGVPPLVG